MLLPCLYIYVGPPWKQNHSSEAAIPSVNFKCDKCSNISVSDLKRQCKKKWLFHFKTRGKCSTKEPIHACRRLRKSLNWGLRWKAMSGRRRNKLIFNSLCKDWWALTSVHKYKWKAPLQPREGLFKHFVLYLNHIVLHWMGVILTYSVNLIMWNNFCAKT